MQSDNTVLARVSVRRVFFCLVVPLCCICCCYVGAGTSLERQYTCPDNSFNGVEPASSASDIGAEHWRILFTYGYRGICTNFSVLSLKSHW